MARIVGALGVPHTPIFPLLASKQGPEGEIATYFEAVRKEMLADRPDLIVIFDTDHLNTFFLGNLPMLAVGVDDRFEGPNDEVPNLSMRNVPSDADFAAHLRAGLVAADYDVALVQQYEVDHSIAVPLHFLTPDFDIPVVPVFINGHIPPLPSAGRCYALGQAVREVIERFPGDRRVEIIGTGSFSLEVAGPRINPNANFGVPDPDWALRVQLLMEQADIDRLIAEATPERMLGAGNVGGELLNWIAMLGAIGPERPKWMRAQLENGHAYGAWAGRAA